MEDETWVLLSLLCHCCEPKTFQLLGKMENWLKRRRRSYGKRTGKTGCDLNLLYFEEFRRDIFIKRLSGLRFLALHQNYLITQLTVILIGFCLIVFITKSLRNSIAACLFFVINGLLILYRQMKSENKLAISVLKGK
mgnify:CR=1 FL=1